MPVSTAPSTAFADLQPDGRATVATGLTTPDGKQGYLNRLQRALALARPRVVGSPGRSLGRVFCRLVCPQAAILLTPTPPRCDHSQPRGAIAMQKGRCGCLTWISMNKAKKARTQVGSGDDADGRCSMVGGA